MTIGENQQEIYRLLQSVPLARGLSPEELGEFLASSQVRLGKYSDGETIFHEGDKPDRLFLLIQGKVEILANTYSGRQLILGEVDEPGDIFGEVYLFLGHKKYDMYTKAVGEVQLLEIYSQLFMDGQPEAMALTVRLQQNLLHAIAWKTYFIHNRLKVLSCGSLREKIARYILQLPHKGKQVQLPEGRELMAAHLAVARPSLSRELGKMQQEGIISVEGNKLEILNVEAFEELL